MSQFSLVSFPSGRTQTYRPPVKVLCHTQYQRLVLRDLLRLVSPLPCDLDGRLDCLGTGVHGEDHLETEKLCDKLGEFGEDIVVEGSRAQGQSGSLLSQSLDELRVAMTLIDGTICGEEVQILLAWRLSQQEKTEKVPARRLPSGSQTKHPAAREKTMGRGW